MNIGRQWSWPIRARVAFVHRHLREDETVLEVVAALPNVRPRLRRAASTRARTPPRWRTKGGRRRAGSASPRDGWKAGVRSRKTRVTSATMRKTVRGHHRRRADAGGPSARCRRRASRSAARGAGPRSRREPTTAPARSGEGSRGAEAPPSRSPRRPGCAIRAGGAHGARERPEAHRPSDSAPSFVGPSFPGVVT